MDTIILVGGAFDRAYYITVLSVLWIHYHHDHYLFTRADVIRG